MITDPLFYLIAVPVVLLSGVSKTGIPGLFGGMAVPLLSLVIPPLQAAAVMLPVLCFIDLFGLRVFWGVYDRRNMFYYDLYTRRRVDQLPFAPYASVTLRGK